MYYVPEMFLFFSMIIKNGMGVCTTYMFINLIHISPKEVKLIVWHIIYGNLYLLLLYKLKYKFDF